MRSLAPPPTSCHAAPLRAPEVANRAAESSRLAAAASCSSSGLTAGWSLRPDQKQLRRARIGADRGDRAVCAAGLGGRGHVRLVDVRVSEDAPPAPASEAEEHHQISTRFVAETLLPTTTGNFRVRAYRHTVDGVLYTEPLAIVYGDIEKGKKIPVRVHDACFTSEVLGSLKCDCSQQLQLSLDYIRDQGPGMVIYLQQEGRGIGLANKIAAYRMQEDGHDTVDANRILGFPDDSREYTAVRNILTELEVESILLMTNNPRKIDELTGLGIDIAGRVPVIVESNPVNEGYLAAKEKRMDHMLDGDMEGWGENPQCYWDHPGDTALKPEPKKLFGPGGDE